MLKNNLFAYEDEYMYFTFNGTHSSMFNMFIQQPDFGIQIYSNRGTSVDFIQPAKQHGQFLLGVAHPQKPWSLDLVADAVSDFDIQQILQWLQPGSSGTLSFDNAPDWEYYSVITELKQTMRYPLENGLFVFTAAITFVSQEESVAHNKYVDHIQVELEEIDTDHAHFSSRNNSYNLPSFSIRRNYDNTFIITTHFLGNYKTTIDVMAFNDETTDIRNGNTLSMNIPDVIFPQYNYAFVKTKSTSLYTGDLHYNSFNNLFLINDRVGEKLVREQELDSSSKFQHNNTGLHLLSGGAPHMINSYSKTEIEQLLACHQHWFIYKTPLNADKSVVFYQPSSYEVETPMGVLLYDTDYISAEVVDSVEELTENTNALVAEQIYLDIQNNANQMFYFGLYQEWFITTDYDFLVLKMPQYTYTT